MRDVGHDGLQDPVLLAPEIVRDRGPSAFHVGLRTEHSRAVLDLEVEAEKLLEKTKHVRFGWSSPGLSEVGGRRVGVLQGAAVGLFEALDRRQKIDGAKLVEGNGPPACRRFFGRRLLLVQYQRNSPQPWVLHYGENLYMCAAGANRDPLFWGPWSVPGTGALLGDVRQAAAVLAHWKALAEQRRERG
jgi:hypothetical protein